MNEVLWDTSGSTPMALDQELCEDRK